MEQIKLGTKFIVTRNADTIYTINRKGKNSQYYITWDTAKIGTTYLEAEILTYFKEGIWKEYSASEKTYTKQEVVDLLFKSMDALISKDTRFRKVFDDQMQDFINTNLK
jgi:hypothetical protein